MLQYNYKKLHQIASVDKSTPVTALQDCTYFTRKEILR